MPLNVKDYTRFYRLITIHIFDFNPKQNISRPVSLNHSGRHVHPTVTPSVQKAQHITDLFLVHKILEFVRNGTKLNT